jgi:hypothetical protein
MRSTTIGRCGSTVVVQSLEPNLAKLNLTQPNPTQPNLT